MRDELEELAAKDEDQYFYEDYLEELSDQHVAWIDLMGVLDALDNDQQAPAVWRGELFSVISEYLDHSIASVFSVGDGVIIMTDDEDYLKEFLQALFSHYITFNLNRYDGDWSGYPWLHRLIRAGMGSGSAYKIRIEDYLDVFKGGSPFRGDYFANTPFGPALIRALQAERGAPFSIHVIDEEDEPQEWKWWQGLIEEETRRSLLHLLNEYFNWFDGQFRYRYSPYESNHLMSALRYFEITDFPVDSGI